MTFECRKCHETKPTTEFYRSSKYSRGHANYCKLCMQARIHEWRANNPTRVRHSKRRRDYQRKYGITIAGYEALFDKQHGRCAICEKHLDKDPVGAKHTTHIDHDHTTSQVRGLLCSSCNTSLGVFGDQAERLRKAADYLDNPPAQDLPLKTEMDASNVRELHLFDAA